MSCDFLSSALDYASRGIPVFPCAPDDKIPLTWDGFKSATTDETTIREWGRLYPTANIAIVPEEAGWCVIDLDGPEAEAALAVIWAELGISEPHTRQVSTPRGFRHLYFEGSLPPSAGRLGPHIDTRGRSSYVLVPPSSIKGNHYVWTNDAPLARLPDAVGTRLAPKERAASANIQDLDTGPNMLRARSVIDNWVRRGDVAVSGQGGNDRTFRAASTILDIVGTPALAWPLLESYWNPHCMPPWDSEELEALVEHAAKYRQNDPGCYAIEPAAVTFAHVEAPPEPTATEVEDARRKSRFWPRSEDEAAALVPPVWNVVDVLMAGTSSLVWAASGSLKTFIVFDLAAHVSLGLPWCGRETRQGLVFYAVGAGEGRIELETKRRAAWKEAHGGVALPNLFVMNAPRLMIEGEVEEFIAMIRYRAAGAPVRLIVIDTAAKAMVGLNENDAGDVGKLTAMTADLCEAFPDATVQVVHHAGKDGETVRGSSALVANFDSVLRVKRIEPKGLIVELHVEQHRDAPEPEPFTLEARPQPGSGSLALIPRSAVDHEALAAERAAKLPFSRQSVGGALIEAKAYGRDKGLTTMMLARVMAKVQAGRDMEEAELGMAAMSIAQRLGALGKKGGALEMLNDKSPDGGLIWWLPKVE